MQDNTLNHLGEIGRRRGIAYYHQLYMLLSAALNDGLIAAGSALPSETDLMQRFQVSRNTVRRALAQLEKEKRIIRRRGSGSYARNSPRTEIPLDTIVDMLQSFDAAKMQIVSRLLRVQISTTPEFIRLRDPQFADKSLLIQRCHTFKTTPLMLSTSYVPEHLAIRLTRRQLSRQAALIALDAVGFTAVSAEQTTTAVLADAVAARHLGVEPAAALLCVHRLIKNGEGHSIEHQSHLFRPDRFQLRSRLALERSPSGLRWSNTQSADMPAWL